MEHLSTYGVSYGTRAEFDFRLDIFKTNSAFVKEHNSLGEGDHEVELNYMSTWTAAEYKKMLGYNASAKPITHSTNLTTSVQDIPASVDWRTQGAVTAVKNQGQCGSCWSFSATGAMEGAYAIAGHGLISLSEQQLIDCSTSFGNFGCKGGLMDGAFEYAEGVKVVTEAEYPYAHKNGTCKDMSEMKTKIDEVKSFLNVTSKDPNALAAALVNGPVSIAIDANGLGFQFYKHGILKRFCGANLDHGVLAVGYGTESDGTNFWIVKNSWGAGWGESGYVRIQRDMTKQGPGLCGLQLQPVQPIF